MGSLSNRLEDAVFYGILDTGYVSRENLYPKCRDLVNSGSKIIQLRAKKESAAERREIAFEILPLFQKENAPFLIINDDVELAAEIPGAGLHIGQDDMPAHEARKAIGEGRILGLSTHSMEQAKGADNLAEYLDYFAVGPVFATNTKPGRPAVGLELVSAVSAMNPTLPWFAIGGINGRTVESVRKAGAKRIVVVSDVLVQDDTRLAVKVLTAKFLGV